MKYSWQVCSLYQPIHPARRLPLGLLQYYPSECTVTYCVFIIPRNNWSLQNMGGCMEVRDSPRFSEVLLMYQAQNSIQLTSCLGMVSNSLLTHHPFHPSHHPSTKATEVYSKLASTTGMQQAKTERSHLKKTSGTDCIMLIWVTDGEGTERLSREEWLQHAILDNMLESLLLELPTI